MPGSTTTTRRGKARQPGGAAAHMPYSYRYLRARRRWLVVLAVFIILLIHAAITARLFLSPEQVRFRIQTLLQQQSPLDYHEFLQTKLDEATAPLPKLLFPPLPEKVNCAYHFVPSPCPYNREMTLNPLRYLPHSLNSSLSQLRPLVISSQYSCLVLYHVKSSVQYYYHKLIV